MQFIFRILLLAVAVYVTVNIVPGISIENGFVTSLIVALVWAVINMVIKPALLILTLPITIVTLGLSLLVINALLFWGMELVVPGFNVDGFFAALLGAIVLSIASWLILKIIPE